MNNWNYDINYSAGQTFQFTPNDAFIQFALATWKFKTHVEQIPTRLCCTEQPNNRLYKAPGNLKTYPLQCLT